MTDTRSLRNRDSRRKLALVKHDELDAKHIHLSLLIHPPQKAMIARIFHTWEHSFLQHAYFL